MKFAVLKFHLTAQAGEMGYFCGNPGSGGFQGAVPLSSVWSVKRNEICFQTSFVFVKLLLFFRCMLY